MRSLRSRLLAYGFGVAGAAIAVLALVLARGAGREVRQFVLAETVLDRGVAVETDDLVAAVEDHLRSGGTLAGAGPALSRLAHGRRVLLLDETLRVEAAEPANEIDTSLSILPDGGLRVETHADGIVQVEILRGPLPALRGADGRTAGHLLMLPGPPPPSPPQQAERLVNSMGRWLLWAALSAVLVALGLGVWIASRISRPIEALTRAAERLRAGHHDERVATEAPGEVAQLARAFNALASDLERAESLRVRLVGDVAHELRTPLTRLRGQVEALRDGLLPLDRKAVESLYEEALLLSRLVEDVQQLALADAERLPLRRVPIDAAELAHRAAAAASAQANAAGVELLVEAASPCAAEADPERLSQVLGNLIANALASTPRGGHVVLGVHPASGGDGVEISVTDDGNGIGADHLPQVFERFYRVDESRQRGANDSGGSGLGLAIVREIAEAHGGSATIQSATGLGTKVTIALPHRKLTIPA